MESAPAPGIPAAPCSRTDQEVPCLSGSSAGRPGRTALPAAADARWVTMPNAEETRCPVKDGLKAKQGIEATMNVAVRSHATTKQASEHFDVLIVGAGISGIGSAYHVTKQLPGTSFVILETQASFGGTWTTHRYPGIRSDSDLHTFGYSFKPWVGPPIATAEEILAYMNEVIDENDIARHIR